MSLLNTVKTLFAIDFIKMQFFYKSTTEIRLKVAFNLTKSQKNEGTSLNNNNNNNNNNNDDLYSAVAQPRPKERAQSKVFPVVTKRQMAGTVCIYSL